MHINVKSYSSDDLEQDNATRNPSALATLGTGLAFWLGVIALVLWVTLGTSFANDPYVMKIYPDGTKVILKWSEVGKTFDNGSTHSGAPKIVAYDPSKDGVVPIGQPSTQAPQNTPKDSTPSPMMADKQGPAITDTKSMNEADNYGPVEGFAFRTAVGASFQQSLSGRSNNGRTYYNFAFQPGIRFDLEPSYNITDWFRTGLETSFIYNSLQRFSSGSPADGNQVNYPGDKNLGNSGLFQVPVLANVRFQFPFDGPYRGYAGGGVGAAWDVLQASAGGEAPYTSYYWNFVYQLTAGFSYTVTPGIDIDIAYKMISAPNPSFQGELGQFKATYNHTVEIGMNWRF
jgi:opacity protein-like surface antigen